MNPRLRLHEPGVKPAIDALMRCIILAAMDSLMRISSIAHRASSHESGIPNESV